MKDFSEVDLFKEKLGDAGVTIQMEKDRVTLEPGPNFDPHKVATIA